MQEEYLKELRSLERKVRKLENELSSAYSETVSVRNQWFEIFEELPKECGRKLSALRKELERMEMRAIRAEKQRAAALDGKAMYFARRKKGHEGKKGTPIEDYQGIRVHRVSL